MCAIIEVQLLEIKSFAWYLPEGSSNAFQADTDTVLVVNMLQDSWRGNGGDDWLVTEWTDFHGLPEITGWDRRAWTFFKFHFHKAWFPLAVDWTQGSHRSEHCLIRGSDIFCLSRKSDLASGVCSRRSGTMRSSSRCRGAAPWHRDASYGLGPDRWNTGASLPGRRRWSQDQRMQLKGEERGDVKSEYYTEHEDYNLCFSLWNTPVYQQREMNCPVHKI